MSISDLPLSKIFWGVFAVEAIGIGVMVARAFASFSKRSGPDGGLVGAWIVLIPIVAMGLVAGLFVAAKAPWLRFGCILLLLLPFIGGLPIRAIRPLFELFDRNMSERDRQGALLFREAGQRKLAAAIADRDVPGIKAALAGAGDLNRMVSKKLPYKAPLGDNETMLSFALETADETEAFAEVLRLLLAAGANPNQPHGVPLSTAIMRSTRAMEVLLEAGADVNVEDGRGEPVWWTVIAQGDRGDSDVRRLELLLTHGADTTKRNRRGGGPIEEAVENERWPKVWLLAQRMPGAKDTVVGPDGETVQGRLRREVKLLQESGKPLPEQMRTALEKFEAK